MTSTYHMRSTRHHPVILRDQLEVSAGEALPRSLRTALSLAHQSSRSGHQPCLVLKASPYLTLTADVATLLRELISIASDVTITLDWFDAKHLTDVLRPMTDWGAQVSLCASLTESDTSASDGLPQAVRTLTSGGLAPTTCLSCSLDLSIAADAILATHRACEYVPTKVVFEEPSCFSAGLPRAVAELMAGAHNTLFLIEPIKSIVDYAQTRQRTVMRRIRVEDEAVTILSAGPDLPQGNHYYSMCRQCRYAVSCSPLLDGPYFVSHDASRTSALAIANECHARMVVLASYEAAMAQPASPPRSATGVPDAWKKFLAKPVHS